MGDLNISRQFAQRLGDDTSRRLVKEILQDSVVTDADKTKLVELKKHLEGAVVDAPDEASKTDLINSLTDLNTILGVNVGTDKALLEANLKRLQSFQDSSPNQVNFEGMSITTDGWFGDASRVIRLRDLEDGSEGVLPSSTSNNSSTENAPAPTATNTGDAVPSTTPPTSPPKPTTPVSSISTPNPYVPQETYVPTTAPTATAPASKIPSDLSAEEQQELAANQTAYNQSVKGLQTQALELRNLLNNPEAVTNQQLLSSLQRLADNDSGKAFLEMLRFNPNLLGELQQKGLISESDRKNLTSSLQGILEDKSKLAAGNTKIGDLEKQVKDLEAQLGGVTDATQRKGIQDQIAGLKDQIETQKATNETLSKKVAEGIDRLTTGDVKFENGQSPTDVLSGYLKGTPSPLSDAQLNAYRAGLVKSADDYVATPNQSTYANMTSNLYSNLYVFEKGVPAAQEQAYVKFKEAVLDASQKESNLTHQIDAMTGKTSALGNVETGEDLALKLKAQQQGATDAVASFTKQGESILAYLKANPGQYEGQAADITALEAKLTSLKASKNPQEQMTLLNQISSALDEVYIKSNISKGSAPEVDATKAALLAAKDKVTSDDDKKKLDLLINNPELVRLLPKASEYSAILTHLANKPVLTSSEKELKAALESGDTDKVNAIFTADMFSSFGFGSLALGGSFFTGFGLGSSLFFSPPPISLNAATLDPTSLAPVDREVSLNGAMGTSSFDLGLQSGGLGQTTMSLPFQLNQPNYTYALTPPTPPPPLWLSIPGGSSRAEALSEELASMPEDRRKALVAALQSPEMSGMSQFIQRISAEQPELKQQLDRVQVAETGLEAINQAHWNNTSLLNEAQSALQTQMQTGQAMKAEFSLAKKELEQMIANPDLSAPVKAKLQDQLKVINNSLTAINAGNFPPQDPVEQAKLDSVMKALSTENKPAGLKLSDRLMHQATVEVLNDLRNTPQLMQKLESAPSFKGLTQVFGKDQEGGYTFPQEMIDMLQDKELSPEAAQMLMLQVNRVSHLATAAQTKSVDELEAILKVGKQQTEAGNGGGELTSGMDALASLNTFKTNITTGSMSQFDSVTLMNNIAKEVGPLDLAHENREMRQKVNTAFINNVSMIKNVAQEKLSQLDQQSRATITQAQTGLSAELLKPSTLAALKPALESQNGNPPILSTSDLEPPLDEAKLAKIKTAIEAVKAPLSDSKLANDPAAQAQLQKLNGLETARLAVENLMSTAKTSKTEMLGVIEESKQQYLSGMTELRDQLRAKGISSPKLDAYILNPNDPKGPKFQDVLSELSALTSNSDPEVQALGNGLKSLATNMSAIAMAQDAIANNNYTDDVEAMLIGAIGSGSKVRELMAQFQTDKQSMTPAQAAQKLQTSLSTLADQVEQAAGDPLAMVAVFSDHPNPGTQGNEELVVDPHASPDTGQLPAAVLGGLKPPLGRVVQLLHDVRVVDDQMRIAGIKPPTIHLSDLGIQGFNPPDRSDWDPGKLTRQIASNFRERGDIIARTPPDKLDSVFNVFNRVDQISANADNTFLKGMQNYLKEMNPALQAAGLPGLNLSYIDGSEPLAGDPLISSDKGKAKLSSQAQSLVDKADDLANAILSPKPTVDGKDALSGLLKDFLENIRNLDFQTRKLVMAQFAKRLMNNMITKMYGEKNLENAKYHEKSLDQFKARMKEGIERALEAAEAQASSGQAAMAVGGDLGSKTGGAVADAGISDQALRDEASQFLEPAVQDGVLSRVQKQKILQALFDGSSVTGQEGVMSMLTRFQQINSLITQ
ncbi:MAG: hypothetical protein IV090_06645 [Candidatus Sericytochromatia bacterium]|nr:hypothetical protein [Candidatus Sericytochromatia bacterium]